MSFLPGIFGQKQAPAAPAPAAPAPSAPAPTAAPTGAAATQQQSPANPAADPNNMLKQLDQFADMFKPKAVDPAAPRPPGVNDPYLGPLDPAAFKQQVSQANFASNIPPDVVQKAISGDAQAFMEAINMASREAFSAAAQLSHGLVEHGARTAAERVSGSLDSRIRNFQIKTQNSSHEALGHPAVAPMMNAVKLQIATSNPQLSPEQVQQQAESYFTQMADVLTAPKRKESAAASAPKSGDFSYLLDPGA